MLAAIITAFSTALFVSAQINIESFDAFAPSQSLNSFYGGNPATDQFTQNAGFITVAPLNGGNPIAGASFTKIRAQDLLKPLDLSGQVAFSLTARLEPGDGGSLIELELDDAMGNATWTYVPASLFSTQAFSTVTVPIESNGLDLRRITRWSIGGDLFPPGGDSAPFRVSFADLSAVPTAPSSLKIGLTPYPGITINGTLGTTYSLQASAVVGGLTNWLTLTNITLPWDLNSCLFIDATATNSPIRFYRAEVVP